MDVHDLIDPANRVIWSATRFSRFSPFFLRSWASCSSAGLTGMGRGRAHASSLSLTDAQALEVLGR